MNELKPCPFCGRKAVIQKWTCGGDVYAQVACQACFASGSPSGGRHSDVEAFSEAVAGWTSRPLEESLQARVTELETENDKLKAVDHLQAVEVAGEFVKTVLSEAAKLQGIELEENQLPRIQFTCAHCGQKMYSKEEALSHDGSCFRHPMVVRAEKAEAELARVKASAVQWVTYDETPETLPDEGRWVMVILSGHKEPVAALCLLHIDSDYAMSWASSDKDWSVSRGDRWAYLPQPPVSGKGQK